MITRHGPPDVLVAQERPEPAPKAGEILIDVRAAGVNFADLMARAGIYPDAPDPPSVIGYEVAGEVAGIGAGVERFAPGDRVLAGTRFGGYQERVCVPEAQALGLPDAMSFEQGAAVPVNYGTAWAALVIMAGLDEGESVLIHQAAGGVGLAAVQIARLRGARILGTASAGKHAALRAQGVEHPIDYRARDFREEVVSITDGLGVDVVIDAVGPSSFRRSYRCLREGGRLVAFGYAEAQRGERRSIPSVVRALARMPLATMPWWKSLALMNENRGVFGLNMLKWWDREGLDRLLGGLAPLVAEGTIEPVVAASFPLDRAADAHRFLHRGQNVGKVVLTPR